MIKNLNVSVLFFVLLFTFSTQARADFVTMDFVSGLNPDVTRTINDGSFTGTSSITPNASNIEFTATSDGATHTGSVRYDFDYGLFHFLGGLQSSQANLLVRFEVAMDSNVAFTGGDFTVTGRYFNSGSSTGTVFSTLTSPSSTGRLAMFTDRTMGELQTNDIDAVEWTVSFSGGGNAGLNNTFTFGSTAGLIAAPEPTSAAMIGCALVGLVARRRRKV